MLSINRPRPPEKIVTVTGHPKSDAIMRAGESGKVQLQVPDGKAMLEPGEARKLANHLVTEAQQAETEQSTTSRFSILEDK